VQQSTNYWPFHRGSRLPVLLQIRWLGQFTDGLFQSALASFVLFSPERQPNAVAAAVAFTVVLLPYSLVGPYAGIFLDRFSRQKIVQIANLIRAIDLFVIAFAVKAGLTGVPLTLLVLAAFGINRLILAGLSAGLPLIVKKTELVAANALAVTGGTIGVVIGGGVGIGLKKFLDHSTRSDLSDALVITAAASLYLISALTTSRLKHKEIGPHEHEMSLKARGWREMREGFEELREHGDSLRGILATSIQRGGLTALTLMGLLLERNTYHPSNNPDAGLSGFAFALGIAGVGIGLGSLITPIFVDRIGRHTWIRIMMVGSIPFVGVFVVSQTQWSLILAAFFVGLCGQAVKVTNDALVQSKIEDEYRGRVFSFYDVSVNGAIVGGALIAALILPTSGKSIFLPLLICLAYAVTSGYLLRSIQFPPRK
jgi:MFS family permease